MPAATGRFSIIYVHTPAHGGFALINSRESAPAPCVLYTYYIYIIYARVVLYTHTRARARVYNTYFIRTHVTLTAARVMCTTTRRGRGGRTKAYYVHACTRRGVYVSLERPYAYNIYVYVCMYSGDIAKTARVCTVRCDDVSDAKHPSTRSETTKTTTTTAAAAQ